MLIITVTRPLASSIDVDIPFEVLEVAFFDSHAIARLEGDRRLDRRLTRLHTLARHHDPLHFVIRHRRRLAGRPGEVADARRLADQEPRVVVQRQVDHE